MDKLYRVYVGGHHLFLTKMILFDGYLRLTPSQPKEYPEYKCMVMFDGHVNLSENHSHRSKYINHLTIVYIVTPFCVVFLCTCKGFGLLILLRQRSNVSKTEAATSALNQPYDQQMAKFDKLNIF